ncbi:archease [bacterium]|nr:archease [bacterium]MCI0607319.1 archease [bacterium]
MYEFLGHPSEELIRVTANTVEEVFVDSAAALFELMTDINKIRDDVSFEIELGAPDRLLLLVDWLNKLIFVHEVEHVFLNNFRVHLQPGSTWNLSARVSGQKINEQMERRLHAKSATYGQLEWNETPQGHQVQFVIDV